MMRTSFAQWVRETRESKGLTLKQCAELSGISWQFWQRIEADRRKRRDGSPSRPTRATVLKIAEILQEPHEDALFAAGLSREPLPTEEDFLPSIQTFYDNLDPEDQEDLLQLALLKWKRSYPEHSPHSLAEGAGKSSPGLSGDFLCMDIHTGRMTPASKIEPSKVEAAQAEEQQFLLLDAFLRFVQWQDGVPEQQQVLEQDLQQMRRLLKPGRAARS